jgi:hypothetical protein
MRTNFKSKSGVLKFKEPFGSGPSLFLKNMLKESAIEIFIHMQTSLSLGFPEVVIKKERAQPPSFAFFLQFVYDSNTCNNEWMGWIDTQNNKIDNIKQSQDN